jgi:aminoglycoside phosphotransferase
MSRGPGKIERAIEAAIDAEPDNAFTVEDLCVHVYRLRRITAPSKAQRVAVLRAVKSVAKRRDNLWTFAGETVGAPSVYYHADRLLSYAMGRLKADNINHYESRDARLRWTSTEADLRKLLADDYHRKLIAEGGAWWKYTERNIETIAATRAGDQAKLDRLQAEADKEHQQYVATVRRIMGG